MGMVGGGRGAFIGAVHRMAAGLDGGIVLTAGCFSADPEKSHLSGQDFGLDPDRVYGAFQEMAAREAALPAGERIDFVTIVTRNNTHYAVAKAFLEAGFHVVCDKPLCFNLAEARKLRAVVRRSGKVFALTHNYTGYPLVKEARRLVRAGKLGRIIKVVAEYSQGYAMEAVDGKGDGTIANWRTDPAVAGAANCVGDIGTHAENLARYISGMELEAVCAQFSTFVPGRTLEDDANLLLRYRGGAVGVLFASQVSLGEENNLVVRIYGTEGALAWRQEQPNELAYTPKGQPARILRPGNAYLGAPARGLTRLPPGHPEAFIEAFANVYRLACRAIAAAQAGRKGGDHDFPGIDDGVAGMAFIDAAVRSARAGGRWTKVRSDR
jgi:predicted dehydrogenase